MKAANAVADRQPWLVVLTAERFDPALRRGRVRRDYTVRAPDRKWAEILARSSALAEGFGGVQIVASGPSL